MIHHKNIVALTTAIALALFHAVWQAMVAFKIAKPFMDWVLSLHSINLTYTVTKFNWMVAITLVVFTFAVGYVMGWLLACLWALVTKKKK